MTAEEEWHEEEQIQRGADHQGFVGSGGGAAISDVCRKHGISDQTYYNWKAKYGGMTVSEAKRLRALEEENRKLKQIVADLTLDNMALKEIASINF